MYIGHKVKQNWLCAALTVRTAAFRASRHSRSSPVLAASSVVRYLLGVPSHSNGSAGGWWVLVVVVVVAAFASLRDRSTNRSNSPLMLRYCFTATETVGLLGTGTQDGHLDFHTAPELWIPRLCSLKKKKKSVISVHSNDVARQAQREAGY